MYLCMYNRKTYTDMRPTSIIIYIILCSICGSMYAATERLRIMTYNVPRNNDYILPEGVNTLDMRFAALTKYVNEVRPDVLGMQEPTKSDLWMFLPQMYGYAMIGVGRNDGIETGQYTLILYRTDKYRIEKDGYYFLSKTPDVGGSKDWGSECPRLATWAIFRDKVTQARFLYTNTHLDHISDSARENQMRIIKEHMRDIIAENGNMPMMITGDFNVYSNTSGAYINATKLHIPMNDAWLVAKKKEGLTYSFPSFEHTTKRKIDYIILSKDITVEKARIDNSVQPNGTIISDHNPHWADITWETTADEDTEALLYAAQEAYDSTLVFTPTSTKLITNATEGNEGCQVTYDTQEPTGGKVEYLIDGNTSTYFRSSWSTINPYQAHYFQVDLRKTCQYVHFDYARLAGTSSTATGNCWVDVIVTASNDNINWDYVTEFYDIPTTEGLHTLPTIKMRQPYRYLRFAAMRTPDMKIRTSYVQYVLSEFQLYEDVIDSQKSQRCFNAEVKAACDALLPLMAEVSEAQRNGTLTSEQTTRLRNALQQLRSVKIDKTPLRNLRSQAADLLNTFKSGTKYGQGSADNYNTLKALIDDYNSRIEAMDTKAKVDDAYATLLAAKEAYMASRVTFKTDKWYYIQSRHMKNNIIKGKMYGQALYASGNGSGAELRNGYYTTKDNTLACLQNPYAMWRIVKNGDAYAIQNRATGLYIGMPTSDSTAYNMSGKPIAYNIDIMGVEDFHFSAADGDSIYLTAMEDNTVAGTDGGFRSTAAWLFADVDDTVTDTLLLPVANHSISIMTLPYPYKNAQKKDIHTYTLVGMPTTNTFELKEKNTFAAGEPFFIMTGDLSALDPASTETTYIAITPPNDFVTEATAVNGMYGLLDDGTMSRFGCYVQDNKIKLGKANLQGNTGYILKNEVQTTSDTHDITISATNGVSGITPVLIPTEEKTNVYTIDGKQLYNDINTSALRRTLPKGTYIIGKKKIIIK